jgi:MFS family permease
VGAFADRVESTGQREMMIILALGAVASFGLALVDSPAAFVIVMPLALLGSWGWPGLIYFTVVRIHPEATARASGVILASNLTGTLVGPSVVGQLADRGNFNAAWVFVGGLSLVSSGFMGASWSMTRRDMMHHI